MVYPICHGRLAKRNITLALLAATTLSIGTLGASQGAQAQNATSYDVPAGPLSTALNQFARQAGVELIYDAPLTEGAASPGLKGSFGAAEALSRLLAGTGLTYRQTGPRTFTLERVPRSADGAIQLGPVRVEGGGGTGVPGETLASAEKDGIGPVIGYAARRSVTATKTDTPIVETPQSIAVVTAQQIRDTASTTLDQALAYSAGVRTAIYGVSTRLDAPQIRGVEVEDIFLDGLKDRVNYWTSTARMEPYLLERLEVLRGPSSMLYGQGGTAGLLNAVSKLPQPEARHEIGVQVGSFDKMQAQADFTGPLTQDGKLLYRIVALGRDSDTQIDYSRDDRIVVAPSLTWVPDAATELTVRLKWQKDRAGGDSGTALPWSGTIHANPNGRLPRDTFVGQPGLDRFHSDVWQAGWSFSHAFSDQWKLRQNFRWTDTKTDYAAIDADGDYIDADERLLNRWGYFWKNHTRVLAADQNIEGNFTTGAIAHRVLIGFDFLRYRKTGTEANDSPISDGGRLAPIDVYAPVYQANYVSLAATPITPNGLRQIGLYVQDEMRVGGLIALLGLRQDWSRNWEDGADTRNDRATTKRFGLMYEVIPGLLPYVSYAESFMPQANTDFGQRLEPLRGKQWEFGAKYEPEDGSWRLSAAYFSLREVNRTEQISDFEVTQRGKTKNTGLEVEWVGHVAPLLDLNASYTLTDVDPQLNGTPKHLASAWTSYKFDLGNITGFSAGLGVQYASGFVRGEGAPRTPAYTLFDAMIAWDTTNWRFALNASNLTDKVYFRRCSQWGNCSYGAARNVTFSAAYHW